MPTVDLMLIGATAGKVIMAMNHRRAPFDDLRVLTPTAKLVGQIVAALVLVKAGIMIRLAFLPEWAALGLTVTDISTEEPHLEQVFLSLTQRHGRAERA